MLSEKEAAKYSGIRPALLRYYRESGMISSSDDTLFDDSVAQQVHDIELLLKAGFRECDVATMKNDASEIPALCQGAGKRSTGSVSLRYYLQNGTEGKYPSSFTELTEKLAPIIAEEAKKEQNKQKILMRCDRKSVRVLGICAFVTVCVFLMGEAAFSLWLRGSVWQIGAYAVPLIILFFGIDWMRYITVAVTFLDIGILALTWDHLGDTALESGVFIPLLISIILIAIADILLLLSKNLQSFLFRRRHRR